MSSPYGQRSGCPNPPPHRWIIPPPMVVSPLLCQWNIWLPGTAPHLAAILVSLILNIRPFLWQFLLVPHVRHIHLSKHIRMGVARSCLLSCKCANKGVLHGAKSPALLHPPLMQALDPVLHFITWPPPEYSSSAIGHASAWHIFLVWWGIVGFYCRSPPSI